MHLQKINDEVYKLVGEIVRFGPQQIRFIKKCAATNARGRARICAHKESTDQLHEMLIAITSNSYIPPHRHNGKSESLHLVEGNADIVVFEDNGELFDVVELGSGQNFYYRLNAARYHTLIVKSPVLVVHETTNGPFDQTQRDFASFAPSLDGDTAKDYLTQLALEVNIWKGKY